MILWHGRFKVVNTYSYRKLKSALWMFVFSVFAIIAISFLAFITIDVFINGISALSPMIFVQDQVPPFMPELGGLRFAIVGHLIITALAILLGIPLGILAGTFLAEYGKNSRIKTFITIFSDMMLSIPSIVIGTFVYAIAVVPFGSYSALAGSLALAIIMFPVVLRITEDMMNLVPKELREAGFALGAPYYKVIFSIVYRSAASGIITGVILAIGRVAGETAPLLFTSFNNNYFTTDLTEPMASLTVTIFNYAGSPYENWQSLAWAGAFIITAFVLFINIASRLLVSWRYGKDGNR